MPCHIVSEMKLDFKDVLLRPGRSFLKSRSEVDLFREITFRNSKQTYRGIPIMAANMDTTGTFEMAKALSKHGLFTSLHKYYTADEWKKFSDVNPECLKNVAVGTGMAKNDFDRLKSVLTAVPELSFICINVANAFTDNFVQHLKKVRSEFPHHTIIAGAVSSTEMVQELILSGADIVKVGIGPGSVCTTRLKTGVGYPQLSCIIECAEAAHRLQGHIIADGGCVCAGDIVKAFAAGGDFVMLGGMLAGYEECNGDIVVKDGKKFKTFYGSYSAKHIEKHAGDADFYVYDDLQLIDTTAPEGKSVEIPYKGKVESAVLDILGSIRSACTYVGAFNLKELMENATFIRCTQQTNNIFGSPF